MCILIAITEILLHFIKVMELRKTLHIQGTYRKACRSRLDLSHYKSYEYLLIKKSWRFTTHLDGVYTRQFFKQFIGSFQKHQPTEKNNTLERFLFFAVMRIISTFWRFDLKHNFIDIFRMPSETIVLICWKAVRLNNKTLLKLNKRW